MLRRRRRFQGGFSLIELFIVVLITSILTVIATPNYLRMQCKARTSEAKSIMRSIYTMQMAYYAQAGNMAADYEVLHVDLPRTTPSTALGEHYMFWIWAAITAGTNTSCMGATGFTVPAGEFSICYHGPNDPRNGVLTIDLPACL